MKMVLPVALVAIVVASVVGAFAMTGGLGLNTQSPGTTAPTTPQICTAPEGPIQGSAQGGSQVTANVYNNGTSTVTFVSYRITSPSGQVQNGNMTQVVVASGVTTDITVNTQATVGTLSLLTQCNNQFTFNIN